MAEIKGGWGGAMNSRKWHYYDTNNGGRALCGGFMFFGNAENLEDSNDNSADNCAACKKKILKTRTAK